MQVGSKIFGKISHVIVWKAGHIATERTALEEVLRQNVVRVS